MTDPISDMLIRIKNAQRAGHETVLIPHSKFKQDIAKVLEKEGWVEKTEKRGRKIKKFLEIFLHGKDETKKVNEVKIISRPSRRLYAGHRDLRDFSSKRGLVIVSTPKGVMSGKEAYKAKLGGQLIAEIW
ncbi:MAG: 30S ribosomal protein S8 [bacterium]|nr:30S ribosomal protein S8 [bacterium]